MLKRTKALLIIGCCVFGLSVSGIIVYKSAFAKASKDSSLGKSLKTAVFDGDKHNKVVAKVNGISISKADVNYIIWVDNNSIDSNNKSRNESDAIQKCAKEKLLLSEAKKHNVSLTDNEIKKMREQLKSSVPNNPKENQDFISALGMTEDQVIDFILQKQVEYKIEYKYLSSEVLPLVLSDTYETKNSALADSITDLKSLKSDADGNQKKQKILNLFEAYKNMLLSDAKLEIT
jgi:hypothetical protein